MVYFNLNVTQLWKSMWKQTPVYIFLLISGYRWMPAHATVCPSERTEVDGCFTRYPKSSLDYAQLTFSYKHNLYIKMLALDFNFYFPTLKKNSAYPKLNNSRSSHPSCMLKRVRKVVCNTAQHYVPAQKSFCTSIICNQWAMLCFKGWFWYPDRNAVSAPLSCYKRLGNSACALLLILWLHS